MKQMPTDLITYDFVFVVLVYRNTKDLEDFFSTLTLPSAKVIVVNSFYNEESRKQFETIAKAHDADFLNVENKGYGYGNNRGCEHALQHYQFKYLIISNADIEIKKLDISMLSQYENSIIAPNIQTLTGKRQNPFMPYYLPWLDSIKNWIYKHDLRWMLLVMAIQSRLTREFYLLIHRWGKKTIYAAHGSFIIFSFEVIQALCPIYNERMFLFSEEEHLAQKAKRAGIPIYYEPTILIKHKEDGSTSAITDQFVYFRSSYIEYYSTWYHDKNS